MNKTTNIKNINKKKNKSGKSPPVQTKQIRKKGCDYIESLKL